jgi:tetratricopeptide (TPR) repeat protein
MRAVTLWVVVGLLLAIVGLVVWGVLDGQAAARPWLACKDPDSKLDPRARIAACSRAIQDARAAPLEDAYRRRADLYLEQRSYPAAVADVEQALALQPDSPDLLNFACWARAVGGIDLDRARQRCDRVIGMFDADTPYAEALDSRGLVGLKQHRDADAFADYDAAVKARPKRGHYLFGRGIAELRLGREEAGRADLAAAAALEKAVAHEYEGYGVAP